MAAMNQVKMLTAFVSNNDATGLNKALKASKPDQSVLQEVVNVAALLGDDQGLRVLFMHGAQATKKAYNLASKTTNIQGHGGHTLAAVYIESIMNNLVDPKKPLSKLKLM